MPRFVRTSLLILQLLLCSALARTAEAQQPALDPLLIAGSPEAQDPLPAIPAATADANAAASDFADVVRRLEELEKQAAAAAVEKKPDDDWIDVSSEKWTVKLGGHVQTDYITWARADPTISGDQNYFEFRRLRLVADGTGYGVFDFRLQVTLEPETVGESGGAAISPDVKDAYLSMNEIPFLGRFRIGNFFVPFSLEQVTNDRNNVFLERSIPTTGVFTVDREVGAAFYNCSEDRRLTWTGGQFFDSNSDMLKERIDHNQG
ncbi:MAG: porin, partial [Pirellulaceae bacterium]